MGRVSPSAGAFQPGCGAVPAAHGGAQNDRNVGGSAAKSFGDKVLAVVLTGMGADGREGARMLKQGGSQVWAQDEASCVIYGMPMAIVKASKP